MVTVFISYGGTDEEFAERLNNVLNDAGIRTFFFPESATPGEKLHRMMRDNINTYDKIIFICSEASLIRPGVLNELEETLQREAREGGEQILIPISLDSFVFTDWNPPRTGLKQAILDRVVGNFIGALTDGNKFARASGKLIAALGSSLDIRVINSEVILMLNETGSSCVVTMRRTFVTYTKRKELLYSGLNTTGKIRALTTSFGNINPIVTEGGNKAITVTFDDPLPVNEQITHSLTIEHVDAFTESIESYSVHRLIGAEKFSITVNFPITRLVKDAHVKINETGRKNSQPENVFISPGKDIVRFEIDNPLKGSYYNVVWSW